METEEVYHYDVELVANTHGHCVSNVPFLINMGLDKDIATRNLTLIYRNK